MSFPNLVFFCFVLLALSACEAGEDSAETIITQPDEFTIVGEQNFLTDYPALLDDDDINVVIEIPAGTTEKWEVNKYDGTLGLEHRNGKPRILDYLAYPGNYGMIPQTLLPQEKGGDGDPLDVIVLGAAIERGSVVKCKPIGVLKLLDRGEQDDKIIAVHEGSPLYEVNGLTELNTNYRGISSILHIWFKNYKGPGKMASQGFDGSAEANRLIQRAAEAYQDAL